ncbi:MAG: GDSL family lipase [Lachnospiraceae bacterium]|nr:GDSL family lipase [Lachnospiraceae bacterium]
MLKEYDIQKVPNLKVLGRTFPKASPLPIYWNHSGIEVNCTGTELWVDIECDYDFYEIWVASEVNRALMARQMIYPGKSSICLYRNMAAGTVKNVRFYRDLQAMNEAPDMHLNILGLRTDGEFLPVKDGRLKVEFVGDSITSGEGAYGNPKETEWLSMFMCSGRSYSNIIERMMDVETRVLSQGGWGVYIGWDNNRRNNIPSIYEGVCRVPGLGKNEENGAFAEHDFASWQPDAVIVNLGTNDDSSFNSPGMEVEGYGFCKSRTNPDGTRNREDLDHIRDAAVDFLKMLRQRNPKAHLIWAYGMMGNNLEPVFREAVKKYTDETGDDNVIYIALPDTVKEKQGAHSHPGFFAHIDAARILGKYLSEHFNVPFDPDFTL